MLFSIFNGTLKSIILGLIRQSAPPQKEKPEQLKHFGCIF